MKSSDVVFVLLLFILGYLAFQIITTKDDAKPINPVDGGYYVHR